MRFIPKFLVAAVVVGAFAAPGSALADSAYKTERLEFEPVTVSETGSGMVVNIHPNGPVIGALERYQLKNAQPNTKYDVWLVVAGRDFTQTATIFTDRHGNGHSKAGFSADDLAPFSGFELPVQWVLRTDDFNDAYTTGVTIVTLD